MRSGVQRVPRGARAAHVRRLQGRGVPARSDKTVTFVETLGVCLLVFVCSCLVDFAHARYVQSVHQTSIAREYQERQKARHHAAAWSLGQWMSATVGFVVAVKLTLWALPFEAAGLYLGTLIGIPRQNPAPGNPVQHP